MTFRSHLDGRLLELTPERAVAIQEALGADVAMCLDHCPALPAAKEAIAEAVDRTIRWAGRCKAAHTRPDQALFGIVQGGATPTSAPSAPRPWSRSTSTATPSAGVSVGESREEVRAGPGGHDPPAARPTGRAT